MSKIEQLRAMPIIGNAYHDHDLFQLAHEILVDETLPVLTRYEALRRIDDAMGENPPMQVTDEGMMEEVREYVDECAAMESVRDGQVE